MLPVRRISGVASTSDLPRFEASFGSPWGAPPKGAFGGSFGESMNAQTPIGGVVGTSLDRLPSKRGERVKFNTKPSPDTTAPGEGGGPLDYETSIVIPNESSVALEGLAHLADPAMGGGLELDRRSSLKSTISPLSTARLQSRAAARSAMRQSRNQPSVTTNPFQFGEQVESKAFSRSPPNEEAHPRQRFITKEYDDLLQKMKRLEKFVEERLSTEEVESKGGERWSPSSPPNNPEDSDGTLRDQPSTVADIDMMIGTTSGPQLPTTTTEYFSPPSSPLGATGTGRYGTTDTHPNIASDDDDQDLSLSGTKQEM
jgi:hypothetical protein